MTYDPIARLLLTPVDRDAPERDGRLRALGLGQRTDQSLDVYARQLARLTGAPCAGVNFVGSEGQFFAGLYTASGSDLPRALGRDHGFCPHVVVRRKALVLEDVRDFPKFASNPAVDGKGVRAYLGAPLIDRTGMALGTLCAFDTAPRRWGRGGLETAKTLAAELVAVLHRREDGML